MSTKPPSIYLGLMSGTSLDGVDIAAVDFSTQTPRLIAAETVDYDSDIAQQLKQAVLNQSRIESHTLAQLDQQLGLSYAKQINTFIQQHKLNKTDIAAIGSHGHTLLHQPPTKHQAGYSMQIGDPNTIAAQTACTVIADFRRADMALGGHGAPLAPAFHGAFLSDANENRIVVNIGGIANISLLDKAHVSGGFDTGPGNTLMDNYCQQYFATAYDKDGAIAATGQVNQALCSVLLTDPYFALSGPKSTGLEYFNLNWLEPYLVEAKQTLSKQDILASLCYLTAKSIANACIAAQKDTARLLVCGGGAHNPTLIKMLQDNLPYPVQTTDAININSDYIEAMAFAWFAKQRLDKQPANLPQVTGAKAACLLGAVYQI